MPGVSLILTLAPITNYLPYSPPRLGLRAAIATPFDLEPDTDLILFCFIRLPAWGLRAEIVVPFDHGPDLEFSFASG